MASTYFYHASSGGFRMFRFYATDLPRLWAMALTLEDVLSRNGVDSNLSNGLMVDDGRMESSDFSYGCC